MHLLNLLNVLNAHSYLKNKLALKGGTALNLFIFDMPRLSVDIDLNYIGEVDREKMLTDRPKIEQAMQAVFEREGFMVKRIPSAHAGGKWRLGYQSYIGKNETLEVDINYVYRQPLWDPVYINSWIVEYGKGLVDECRNRLKIVLPFTEKEKEFLEQLLGKGNIRPDLLTDKIDLQERIDRHPGLLWQAKKARPLWPE